MKLAGRSINLVSGTLPSIIAWVVLFSLVIANTSGFGMIFQGIEKISLSMKVRKLEDNKVLEGGGTVYYRHTDNKMVTRFTTPEKMLIISDEIGEMKTYDQKNNMVAISQRMAYSTKNSFLYLFLSGNTEYMGLKKEGYKVQDTEFKENLTITTFLQDKNPNSPLKKAELVHEDRIPVFMAFYNENGKAVEKIYYANFKTVADKTLPTMITEINYTQERDSIVVRKNYSDIRINDEVDETYLNFKIPQDAKIVD